MLLTHVAFDFLEFLTTQHLASFRGADNKNASTGMVGENVQGSRSDVMDTHYEGGGSLI